MNGTQGFLETTYSEAWHQFLIISLNSSALAFDIKNEIKLLTSEGKNYYQLRLYLDRRSLSAPFYFKYNDLILILP